MVSVALNERFDRYSTFTSFKEECSEWLAVFKTEVICAILPSSVLCIAVQTIIHERPQAIWRPEECSLGLVSQDL
jgi:hypothetical protein